MSPFIQYVSGEHFAIVDNHGIGGRFIDSDIPALIAELQARLPQPPPEALVIKAEIAKAREAVTTLRDATRQGIEIGFRQRDPLVMAVHRALDRLDTLSAPPAPHTERTTP